MEKIRTILVEDEDASLYLLKEELHPYQNIKIVAEFRNGQEGLEGINTQQPDLVFVDIEMPTMDGFQMLQKLTCSPVIIFCTGHKKYALEAWDFHAADFIIKPVESKRVKLALQKALDDIKNKKQDERLIQQKLFAGFIELSWQDPNGKKHRYFAADEILYLQGDRDYLKVYLAPQVAADLGLYENLITIKKTIKEANQLLEKHGFMQIHKSYLINMRKVLDWNRSNKELRLQSTDVQLPIGRSFAKLFQKKWEGGT